LPDSSLLARLSVFRLGKEVLSAQALGMPPVNLQAEGGNGPGTGRPAGQARSSWGAGSRQANHACSRPQPAGG
jgi:hypothetical protein